MTEQEWIDRGDFERLNIILNLLDQIVPETSHAIPKEDLYDVQITLRQWRNKLADTLFVDHLGAR